MFTRRNLLAVLVLLVLGSGLTADHENINPRGRPKQFEPGRGPMFAVWLDKGEWHIAATSLPARQNKGQPTMLTGSVWVEGDKVVGDWKVLERSKDPRRADFIVPHKDENGFDFKFALGGGVDTVKFRGGDKATGIKFRLAVEGRQQPGFIYIGANGDHPSKAEFTLPARPGR